MKGGKTVGRFIIKNPKKIGSAPGTLVHVGKIFNEDVEILTVKYNEAMQEIRKTKDVEECYKDIKDNEVCWINIEGLKDISVIESIGSKFKLHPLILEDILNTGQRAKLEDYDKYIFIVLKMLTYDKDTRAVRAEQVSFVLISNCVISFQERNTGIFSNVILRIKSAKGAIRKQDADYLLYALIDAVVDSYFGILENLGDEIDEIEEELIDEPSKEVLQKIHKLKKDMLFLRNSIWPLREVVSLLVRSDNAYFSQNTVVYLRDVYDHIIQIIDTIEVYRDMLSGMLDTYLSSISNKTNDVMKVLTIISTIFIPITFLAGVYGMNFKNIPELQFDYGYEIFWAVSVAITIILIRYFKKKKWI